MGDLIRTLFIVLMAVMGLTLNMNIATYAKSSKYLKEDLEVAVHDASLELKKDELANGKLVFDPLKAKQTFKESLKDNTGFQEGKDYKILEFQVLDQSNSKFPVKYKANTLKFQDTFQNPTLVAIIETTTKKYFLSKEDRVVRRVASYTYKVKTPNPINQNLGQLQNVTANEKGLVFPLSFTQNVTSNFNPERVHPITGKVERHNGVDISAPNIMNQPVGAVKDGNVTFAGTMGGYGNLVILDHGNGFETRYAHLNSITVSKDAKVIAGQIIGHVGSTGDSTGAHLHLETRMNGQVLNPLSFFNKE
ncbi:M23 family metallopeptidase [Bacillus cereus]|uniref:M23 family metallopeptidase n=1 Tax=Bacillus cereus TaxID=1396 RepID=UPI000279193B|nr:M23 family metallopeptidase [Bacillus cereus]EJQ01717.1 hypothetical protein IE1_05559 [Bacillus cereus BAG3O-2]